MCAGVDIGLEPDGVYVSAARALPDGVQAFVVVRAELLPDSACEDCFVAGCGEAWMRMSFEIIDDRADCENVFDGELAVGAGGDEVDVCVVGYRELLRCGCDGRSVDECADEDCAGLLGELDGACAVGCGECDERGDGLRVVVGGRVAQVDPSMRSPLRSPPRRSLVAL